MVLERRTEPKGKAATGAPVIAPGYRFQPYPTRPLLRAANKGGTARLSRRPLPRMGRRGFFFATDSKEDSMLSESTPLISIRGLGKTFSTPDGDFTALKDIDLDIMEGEIFGIIGLSGAGKSTLVRCINFLERPSTGSVTVEGKDLASLSRSELLVMRRRMGMIFQSFNLLSQRTALGNVLFPLQIAGVPRAKAKERALSLLSMVGLADKADSYPSQLSGGQKQRVAIARALATDPKVLLCDEATSALDPTTTASILELLAQINRELGVTVIVITHEMKVIESICHRVAVIDHSKIAEIGPVREVFIRPKSAIARQLIFPTTTKAASEETNASVIGMRMLRLVFDGTVAEEPILANMILQCHAPVSIMGADTKAVGGKAIGQMLIRLPEDPMAADRICAYLTDHGIPFTEEVEA